MSNLHKTELQLFEDIVWAYIGIFVNALKKVSWKVQPTKPSKEGGRKKHGQKSPAT